MFKINKNLKFGVSGSVGFTVHSRNSKKDDWLKEYIPYSIDTLCNHLVIRGCEKGMSKEVKEVVLKATKKLKKILVKK